MLKMEQDKVEPLKPEDPPVMVHVVAPATLPAGYVFEAQIGNDSGKMFTVEVPQGGVNEGDMFLAPLPDNGEPRLNIPTGSWKDRPFDCFKHGICHAHLCCSLFCTQIAMGQVMKRLQLTWLGDPAPTSSAKSTFWICVALVFSYSIYATSLEFSERAYDRDNLPILIPLLKTLGAILFTVWSVVALCRTRENIRMRYSIPEERCIGCEDLCCSLWCSCCTVAQLLRHTGEYETYRSKLFTEDGLEASAPDAV
mmetsp:Transcript_7632/g.10402  ORF Transcript_7632/g.10402 Transcript_7632/m.10402 type:complete len:253 (-) Transcript_7632:391-1149(-)